MKYKSSNIDFLRKSKTSKDLPEWLSEYPELHIQVKTIRESQGISQQKLAENIGLTWRSIPNIESGNVNPKISTLKKIAEFLNCELKILIIPGEGFNKPVPADIPSTETDPSPVKKNLTFKKRSEKNDNSDNTYSLEKKKEYFWD